MVIQQKIHINTFKHEKINFMLGDCMDVMGKYPDEYFDVAIVDPPYGIEGLTNRAGNTLGRLENTLKHKPDIAKLNKWNIKPDQIYFDELFRVSKKQIIWGGNNFKLPTTEYFIIWDKDQTVDNFASAEYAWTNIKKPAKIFRHTIHRVMSDRKKEGGKIHPTQKPVELYRWLLENYCSHSDKILDTHLGSGSIAIASHYYEVDEFVGIEIDQDYFDLTCDRFINQTKQIKLF